MKKRIFSRLMAMVMALSLLSTTGFAAVALEKDKHIGEDGTLLSHKETNKNNEEFDSYDYYLNDDLVLDRTLVVKDGVEASIDLNGHNLALNDSSEAVKNEDGYTTDVSVKDSSGHVKSGSVIKVTGQDTKLSVTDTNEHGGNSGEIGSITGGNSYSGGGVYVTQGAEFEMTGGKISENKANTNAERGGGGAIYVQRAGSKITLNNVVISDNAAPNRSGGGISVDSSCEANLNNVRVENNYSGWAGGGIYGLGGVQIKVTGGSVSNNTSVISGGGVRVYGMHDSLNASITFDGVEINENVLSREDAWGAGVSVQKTAVDLKDTTVTGNIAPGEGGGIYIESNASINITGTNLAYGNSGSKGSDLYIVGTMTGDGTINDKLPVGYIANEDNIKDGSQWIAGWAKHKDHNYQLETKPATCLEDGSITYTCECGESYTEVIEAPGSHDMGEWEVTTPAQPGVPGEETRTCSRCDYTETQPIEALPVPVSPVIDVDFTGVDAGTTIADEETPLAGILTLADLLNALYEHEEIEAVELPEDFRWADHLYAPAISWALENSIVTDDEDFDPDELLTVGLLREVLVNFVDIYKGLDDFTVTTDGADEDLVLDLGERLNVFFAELEK